MYIHFYFSGDDLEEQDGSGATNKPVPPVPVNSHLHCRASNLDLALAAPGSKELKTQKWVHSKSYATAFLTLYTLIINLLNVLPYVTYAC